MGRKVVSVKSSVALVLWSVAAMAQPRAETRPIDVEHSTLTVFVYKSGLFSGFADNHVIRAPIAGGAVSPDGPLSVEMAVRSANLKVLDPGLGAGKQAEVQARMLGPEVWTPRSIPILHSPRRRFNRRAPIDGQ
jgi:hypothetical protein